VRYPVIGIIYYPPINSADGKASIAMFLSHSTKLVPRGFHFIFWTLRPLWTSIYVGKDIIHDPVGVQTNTRGTPVPIINYY